MFMDVTLLIYNSCINNFKATARDMVTKIGFITFEPLFMATFVPSLAPIIIKTATGIPYLKLIFPLKPKIISDEILLIKFSILELAEA